MRPQDFAEIMRLRRSNTAWPDPLQNSRGVETPLAWFSVGHSHSKGRSTNFWSCLPLHRDQFPLLVNPNVLTFHTYDGGIAVVLGV